MNTFSERKRAVVLCDNDLLQRAIEYTLKHRLNIEVVSNQFKGQYSSKREFGSNKLDLIVVALSAPEGEPVVELIRRSLVNHLGKTPLLIISERPFDESRRDSIAHLHFPFTPDTLCCKVVELLQPQEVDV